MTIFAKNKFGPLPLFLFVLYPFLFILFLSPMANPAMATIVIRQNILELTTQSTRIVQGIVTSVKFDQPSKGMVVTLVTLEVLDTLRGRNTQEITFRVPGGELPGGMILAIAGSPSFKVGEEVIVFLEGKGGDIVTGFSQGRFLVEKKGTETFATQDTNGLCMLDARGPSAGETGGPVTDWPQKFSSNLTKSTSQLKAGDNNSGHGEHIHGSLLSVPLDVFKNTIRECNPETYSDDK